MDWFLYDNGLRHEKVKGFFSVLSKSPVFADLFIFTRKILHRKLYFLRIEQLFFVSFLTFKYLAKKRTCKIFFNSSFSRAWRFFEDSVVCFFKVQTKNMINLCSLFKFHRINIIAALILQQSKKWEFNRELQ